MTDESPPGIFLARPARTPDGIALAVKDLFDTAGLVTTYGSIIFADHVPAETAESVLRLEAAGYANVGKTNLHEFAYGITSKNPHFGTVPNPRAQGRLAGGSSGGSAAALAAGLADAALGTDSGGSIRIPAAWCGVVGFKPTYGRVSLDGCFPLAPSFDHAGPMARTVSGCSAAMRVLDPTFKPSALGEMAVGIAWADQADPGVRAAVERAAAAAFGETRPVDFPLPDGVTPMFDREVAQVHQALFAEHADSYGEDVRRKIEVALEVTDAEHDRAVAARDAYRHQAEEALAGLDLLLTPTLAFVAPPVSVEELGVRRGAIRFTFPFNALGWPALALPCGRAEDGLPASLQIVGRPGADGLVLAAGAHVEAALTA